MEVAPASAESSQGAGASSARASATLPCAERRFISGERLSTASKDSARASSDRYKIGDVIGDKYELVSKAGEGAMGVVWTARNTALETNVALKLIRPELRSPALDERFLREARAAAQLTHPAVVRVFDLGQTAHGDPYIVMELLEGEALRDLLDREHGVSAERAVELVLPVVSGLQAAHERGIVHRDIKPDNIVLARIDGGRIQPKLVDFGIAKLTSSDERGTLSGAVLIGTPEYMSPEQIVGGDIDHRTDVWSLCALLYELILGATPFSANSAAGSMCAIIQNPVLPLVGESGVDELLWSIIERGLRKEPEARWQSMQELGEALASWLWSRGVNADVSGASLSAQWLDRRTDPPAPAQASAPSLAFPLIHRSSVPPVSPVAAPPAKSASLGHRLALVALAIGAGAATWALVPALPSAGDSAPVVAAQLAVAPLPAPGRAATAPSPDAASPGSRVGLPARDEAKAPPAPARAPIAIAPKARPKAPTPSPSAKAPAPPSASATATYDRDGNKLTDPGAAADRAEEPPTAPPEATPPEAPPSPSNPTDNGGSPTPAPDAHEAQPQPTSAVTMTP